MNRPSIYGLNMSGLSMWNQPVHRIYLGTQRSTSLTHDDDDSVVLDSDVAYEEHYGVRDPMLDVL